MIIKRATIYSLIMVVAATLCVMPASTAQAATPPGADLVAADHSKSMGYAVLARYELYLSKDGSSWNAANLKGRFTQLTSVSVGKSVILVGTSSGQILRSTDGMNFEPVTSPIDPYGRKVAPIKYLAVGAKDNQLLASSGQGAVISEDGGQTWSAIKDPFFDLKEAREVVGVGFIKKTAVVITRFGPYKAGRKGFVKFAKGLPEGADITVATIQDNRMLLAVLDQGIYFSSGTSSWKKLSSSPGEPVSFAAFADDGLLAARTASPVHFGDSRGKKWQELDKYTEGYLPIAALPGKDMTLLLLRGKGLASFDGKKISLVDLPDDLSRRDLVLDVGGSSVVATQAGLFFTSDNGRSWRDVTPFQMYAQATTYLELGDGKVLVGTAGSGVFMSEDGGMSWQPWLAGLGTANTIRGLAKYEGGVIAATENGLMWTEISDRPRWKPRDGGIGRQPLTDMAISEGKILVSSFSGVYQSSGKGDFKAVKGLSGKVSRLAAAKGKVAMIMGQKVFEAAGARVTELPRLPDGVVPTSVTYADGVLITGATRGAYSLASGNWQAMGTPMNPLRYPVAGVVAEKEGVRVLTRGAGTFELDGQ
jgi:hypothetical protein